MGPLSYRSNLYEGQDLDVPRMVMIRTGFVAMESNYAKYPSPFDEEATSRGRQS